MSTGSSDISGIQSALSQAVREHWVLFLVEGIVLVILGALAIIVPPIATIAVDIFIKAHIGIRTLIFSFMVPLFVCVHG